MGGGEIELSKSAKSVWAIAQLFKIMDKYHENSTEGAIVFNRVKDWCTDQGIDTSGYTWALPSGIDEAYYDFIIKTTNQYMKEIMVDLMIQKFIKKAQVILDKNIKVAALEQKAAEERKKLDKEERDLITEIEDMGLSSFTLTDGTKFSIKETHHCNINKNLDDQYVVAEWLKEQGCGDLVEEELHVSATHEQDLRTMEIPFIPSVKMNTTKVKAWVKEALGYNEGVDPSLEYKDLPKGLHFFTEKQIKFD